MNLAQVVGLHSDRTSVYKMGKHKKTTKASRESAEGYIPPPSSQGGQLEDAAHNLLERVSI